MALVGSLVRLAQRVEPMVLHRYAVPLAVVVAARQGADPVVAGLPDLA